MSIIIPGHKIVFRPFYFLTYAFFEAKLIIVNTRRNMVLK